MVGRRLLSSLQSASERRKGEFPSLLVLSCSFPEVSETVELLYAVRGQEQERPAQQTDRKL